MSANTTTEDAVSVDWFLRLFAHMEWADAVVWQEVMGHEASSADAFVRESLIHLHLVQRAYLMGWQGGRPPSGAADPSATLAEIRDRARAYYPEVRAFLKAVDPEELWSDTDVLWPDLIREAIGREPVRISLADKVHQVASHSVHHRAQINRRIRELGGAPPFIDYVAWAWLGAPRADWSWTDADARAG